MITPPRIHGKGVLMANGAERYPVEFEITAFEVNMVICTRDGSKPGMTF